MDGSPSTNHPTREPDSRPASRKVRLAEGGDLFKLSIELREMIYEHYFSQEGQQTSSCIPWGQKYISSTLPPKLPLLRASKLLRADALPSFYKCHTFRIQHHYQQYSDVDKLSNFMTGGIQPMRRVEMLNPFYIEGNWLKPMLGRYLQGFLDLFPKLRLLILNLVLDRRPGEEGVSSTSERIHPVFLRLLAQLLERLDCLEIALLHLKDDSRKGLDVLQELAPRERWIEGFVGDVSETDGLYKRTAWKLECSTLTKALENRASGMVNHAEEV